MCEVGLCINWVVFRIAVCVLRSKIFGNIVRVRADVRFGARLSIRVVQDM